MTKRQERTEARKKAADEKFEAVLASAIARVKERSELRPDQAELDAWEEASPLDGDSFLISASVRHLRDHQAVSWWQIGQMLGLPGAGDSAATGKGGAGFARKLYAKGFGSAPRTQQRKAVGYRAVDPQNDDRKALKSTTKAERVAMARRGQPVLRDTMTDEEVEAFVAGRHISWSINLHDLDGNGDSFHEQEADVHRKLVWCRERNGQRLVMFYEVNRTGPIPYRERAGAVRTVRLSAIHSVR